MNCTHTHLNPFTHKHTHTCRMRYDFSPGFCNQRFCWSKRIISYDVSTTFCTSLHEYVNLNNGFESKTSIVERTAGKVVHFEANDIAFNWCKKILYGLCLHRICNHEKLDQLSKYLWFLLLWKTSRLSLTQWALENHTVFISINRMREVTW